MVTVDIYAALRAADFARNGVLPVSGGSLDQADSIMSAIQFVWMLEGPFRIKAGLKD